ncbi:MAG: SH3 domain-containing protein [bacterium]|nr:SH3 domain-containing protein [bacterium]
MSKVESLKCPNCGAAIYDENATRCEYCGCALSVGGRKPEKAPEPSAPQYSWVCPKCGGVTAPNFRFCIKCGAEAGDNPKKVPKTKAKPATTRTSPEPIRVRKPRKKPLRGIGGLLSGLMPFFIILVVLIVVLYFSGGLPTGTKNFMDKVVGRGFAVFGELTGSGEESDESGARVRVLAGWPLKLYDEPDVGGDMVGELKPGEEMTVLETRGEWYRVRTDDGREGWVQYVIRGSRVVG